MNINNNTPQTDQDQRLNGEVEQVETAYVKPAVLTHSGEEILDELGPAQACYPFGGCGVSV